MLHLYTPQSLRPVEFGKVYDQEDVNIIYDLPAPKQWRLNIYDAEFNLCERITVEVARVRIHLGPDYGNTIPAQMIPYSASVIPIYDGREWLMSSVHMFAVTSITAVLYRMGYVPFLRLN